MADDKKKQAERMMALFAGNETHHGTHGEPKLDELGGAKWEIKDSARTLKGPPTLAMWQAHLEGRRPLGVVPTLRNGNCTWGSIDIDEYDIDETEVIRRVERAKLPLLPSWSKSGGVHLFLFAKESVTAALMQSTLRDVAASLGYAGSEIFPKQTKIIADKGEMGSWMTMPYLGTTYGDKLHEQVGVKKTGAHMTISEFLSTAERMRVDLSTIKIARSGEESTNGTGKKNGADKKSRPPFSDGPPCIQYLTAQRVPQGGQNNFLFHLGVYYKRKHPEDWQSRLEEANQQFCDPPYPSDKLTSTIKSLDKKDYQYKCKDEPMASHCDAMQCRMRKFGVGAGASYPQITSISKLNSDPPLWFVNVENAKITCTTEELQIYQRFHRLCIEHTHKSFAMISQNVWVGVINDALTNVEVIPATEDVSVLGQLRELVFEYLTNRQSGQTKEDIDNGRPYLDEEDERHYFQLRPLRKFLVREGVTDYEKSGGQARLTEWIKKMGGSSHQLVIRKGVNRHVWFLPIDAVRAQAPAELPKDDGGGM